MKKALLASCLACMAVTVPAQTEVTPYRPGVTLDGVTYYLPRTAVRLVVTAEKTVYTPGEFCKYADRYLRLSGAVPETVTRWTIKSIGAEAYGVPDTTKIYNIRLKSKTLAPLVELTEDGLLLAINTEGEEETLSPVPEGTRPGKRINPRDYMNQEMLSAGSTAKMAELAAQEIYEIRDSRNALIRGEADNTPKDGTQLKLMLDQLATQEEALTQLFKGVTETSTAVFTLNLIPTEGTDKTVLFRFSQKLGLVDRDDLGGEPVYISIKDLKTVPEPVYDEKTTKKKAKMETGVYYNVPSRVSLRVFDAQKTYCKAEYPMGQFGNVEVLSDVLFNKKTATKVTFYQSNGGVRRIEAEEP